MKHLTFTLHIEPMVYGKQEKYKKLVIESVIRALQHAAEIASKDKEIDDVVIDVSHNVSDTAISITFKCT